MPFVTAKTQKSDYDVIVVGSGAAGGQSAYTLCMEGAKVLMLEAGRKYSPETETPMFQTPDMAPLEGRRHSGQTLRLLRRHGGRRLGRARGALCARERRGCRPLRMVAGAHAGRPHESLGAHLAAQRPLRFQAAEPRRAGFGIGRSAYADLAPYYDKVELLIGVYGSNEGLENTPNSPPDACCRRPSPWSAIS